MSPALFEATALGKSYAVPVLADVSFEIRAGEVHAVIGENGAGKSTLAAIVAGLRRPDAGAMRLHDRPYAPAGRTAARDAGVGYVPQEPRLVSTLTVGESLFLDRLPTHAGWIDRQGLRRAARPALDRVGLLSLDPDRPVSSLGVGERQLVQVAAALVHPCAVLVLDEPTTALLPAEAEALRGEIEALRHGGMGVLFVTHRLAEVEGWADRVTVLRDGRAVATRPAREATREEILRLMVGRAPVVGDAPRGAGGAEVLRIEELQGAGFADVSLQVSRGEIVGVAGLRGSGRTSLLRALAGADRVTAGRIFLRGSSRPSLLRTPREAAKEGVTFVPEERQSQGLLLPLSVRTNLGLTRLAEARGRGRLLRPTLEERLVRPLADAYAVRAESLEQPVSELSGGNQQKVLLARALARPADVVLLDEPTRGIDVGARADVHARLRALAAEGRGLLVASSDLEELVALCDRLLVMAEGRLRGEFQRPFSPEAILAAALPAPVRENTA